jgi:integrase
VASIERRELTGAGNAGGPHWRVMWREGGRRADPRRSVTFDDLSAARRLQALVNLNHNRWPTENDLTRHGLATIAAVRRAAACHHQAEAALTPEVTFEQYARTYVDRLVKPCVETRRKYLERLDKHVFPTFGDRRVAQLGRRSEWRAWQTGLLETGLSAKTIANVRGETVHPILEAACRTGEDGEPPLLAHNPLRGLPLPPRHPVEKDIIDTHEEAALFVDLAYQVDQDAAELLVTKLAGGLRWSEVTGLPVRAVHPERGTVAVRQVLVREYSSWRIRPAPKTANGWREIPLPKRVMDMLARRCEGRARDDLVFVGPNGRAWRYWQFYRTRWTPIRDAFQARTGKWLQPHGLRHSMLTLLAASNLDLATLRYVAGHKTIHTTYNLYVHANRTHHPAITTATSAFLPPLPATQAEELVRFTYDGHDYEIALPAGEATAFRQRLAPFIAAARPADQTRAPAHAA